MSSKRMGGSSVDANVLGVRFGDGTYQTTGAVPILQVSETRTNSTDVVGPLFFQVPGTATYQVTMFYFPSDSSGSANQWWHPVFTWTSPLGVAMTSLTSMGLGPCGNGDPTYGQAYSIPLLCKGGTTITVSGYYTVGGYPDYTGGACTPFPIDLSIHIVVMPEAV
jgi:hypothetical protein